MKPGTRHKATQAALALLNGASGGLPWRGDAGRGRETGPLVSRHHKAVQLTEIEERLRGLQEALGLVPGSA